MSNFANAFANGKAFIPFITCGDPDLSTTASCMKAMQDAGADVIQLGIPFSDPVVESPSIQAATMRALKNELTTDDIFEFVENVRKDVHIPIMFMTYANTVYNYGIERFMERCADVGVQGMVLPDVPLEEKDEFDASAEVHGVDIISLIAPSSVGRVASIAESSNGFIYVVSGLGGNQSREKMIEDIKGIVATIREHTSIPCAVGIGITTPEQAVQMASLSDGAIVGSAIINLVEQYGKDAPEHVGAFVKQMKDALRCMS